MGTIKHNCRIGYQYTLQLVTVPRGNKSTCEGCWFYRRDRGTIDCPMVSGTYILACCNNNLPPALVDVWKLRTP